MNSRLPALLERHHGILKPGMRVAPNLFAEKWRGKKKYSHSDALRRFVLGKRLMKDRIELYIQRSQFF